MGIREGAWVQVQDPGAEMHVETLGNHVRAGWIKIDPLTVGGTAVLYGLTSSLLFIHRKAPLLAKTG